MTLPLLIHPEALLEAEAAAAWYGARSERAAVNFVTEMTVAVRRVAEHPSQFPLSRFSARTAILRRFPYMVVFRVTNGVVQIIAVAHGRRHPSYWRDRLD